MADSQTGTDGETRPEFDLSGVPEPLRAAMGRVARLDTVNVVASGDKADSLAAQIASLRAEHEAARRQHTENLAAHRRELFSARLALIGTQGADNGTLPDTPARRALWEAAVVLADDGLARKPGSNEARLAEALKVAECPVGTPIVVWHEFGGGIARFEGHRTTEVPRIGLTSGGDATAITIECGERRLEWPLARIVVQRGGDEQWRSAYTWAIDTDAITRLTQRALVEGSTQTISRVPGEIASLATALQSVGLRLSDIGVADLLRPYVTVALQNVTDPTAERADGDDWNFVLSHRNLDAAAIDDLCNHIVERAAERLVTHNAGRDRKILHSVLETKVRRILSAQDHADVTDSTVRRTVDNLMDQARQKAKARRG